MDHLPYDEYLGTLARPINSFRVAVAARATFNYTSRQLRAHTATYAHCLFESCRTIGKTYCRVQAAIWVSYSDYYGDRTERRVDMSALFMFGSDVYIDGVCSLRGDIRTFKLQRVESATFRGSKYGAKDVDRLVADLVTQADLDPRDLNFSCHPAYFVDRRKSVVAIRLWGKGNGHDDDAIFSAIFKFFAEGSLRGAWREWFLNGQAVAAAALAETIKFSPEVQRIDDPSLLSRHVSKIAFRQAIDRLS